MILLNPLRAERDALAEQLLLWHFDSSIAEHLAWLEAVALWSPDRGWGFGHAKKRLVEREDWDGCKNLQKLWDLGGRIFLTERKEAAALGARLAS